MDRRGFFSGLAKTAAIIALAPQVASKAKAQPLNLDEMFRLMYEIKKQRDSQREPHCRIYFLSEGQIKFLRSQ